MKSIAVCSICIRGCNPEPLALTFRALNSRAFLDSQAFLQVMA
jgi:hypothetical protein